VCVAEYCTTPRAVSGLANYCTTGMTWRVLIFYSPIKIANELYNGVRTEMMHEWHCAPSNQNGMHTHHSHPPLITSCSLNTHHPQAAKTYALCLSVGRCTRVAAKSHLARRALTRINASGSWWGHGVWICTAIPMHQGLSTTWRCYGFFQTNWFFYCTCAHSRIVKCAPCCYFESSGCCQIQGSRCTWCEWTLKRAFDDFKWS
jgi:hypothetical protein